MNEELYLQILIGLSILITLILLFKGSKDYSDRFDQIYKDLADQLSKNEHFSKSEFASNRLELSQSIRGNQEIVNNQLKRQADYQNKLLLSFQSQLVNLNDTNYKSLNDLRDSMTKSLLEIRQEVNQRLSLIHI